MSEDDAIPSVAASGGARPLGRIAGALVGVTEAVATGIGCGFGAVLGGELGRALELVGRYALPRGAAVSAVVGASPTIGAIAGGLGGAVAAAWLAVSAARKEGASGSARSHAQVLVLAAVAALGTGLSPIGAAWDPFHRAVAAGLGAAAVWGALFLAPGRDAGSSP